MKTYLTLENSQTEELPPEFQKDDIRFPASLVRYFLQAFTQPGDSVFDPFAGFGTTLIAAEAMGRIPFGIELNAAKVEYARARLKHPEHLVHGDARQLLKDALPIFDFSLTSPPYMNQTDPEDPFTDYTAPGEGYPAYLRNLRSIYQQIRQHLKPGGQAVIEVANLKQAGNVTPLAWDIAREVAQVLHFEGEIIVCWDHYGYGYDHSYCLVYSAR